MTIPVSPLPGTFILQLPLAISLDGSEYVPLVQGGTTKRATIAQIALATGRSSDGIFYTVPLTGGVRETQTAYNFQRISIKDFGAVGDTVKINSTITIASGSAALLAAGASFTNSDVGKAIYVPGSGAAGAVLATTILAVGNATHITLAASALTAVTATAKWLVYGTDDTAAILTAISTVKNTHYALDIPVSSGAYSHTATLVWAYNNLNVVCDGEPEFIHTGTGIAHSFSGIAVYPATQGCVGGVFGGPGMIKCSGNPAGGTTRAIDIDNWHFGRMSVIPRDAATGIFGFDTGIVGSSCVETTFNGVRITSNTDGAFAVQPGRGIDFTRPNSCDFEKLIVEGCGAGGATAVVLTTAIGNNFHTGTIEGNTGPGLSEDSGSSRQTYDNIHVETNGGLDWAVAGENPVLINCAGAGTTAGSVFNSTGATLIGGKFQSLVNNDNTLWSNATRFVVALTDNGSSTTILNPLGGLTTAKENAATILGNKIINTTNNITLLINSHAVSAVTGTGSTVVLSTAPTIASPTFSGTVAGSGTIPNSVLVNSSATINGTVVSLGGTYTIGAAATSIAVGTTTVSGGTTSRVLYDNAGTLGEYTATQLTAQINPATAILSGALPAWPNNTTSFFRGDGTYAAVALSGLSGLGTGIATALAINAGSAGAPVLFNGAGGTPSSLTLTNAAGLPIAGLANIAGLSTLGRSAATTGAVAAITATDVSQILRVDTAGNTVGFGSINLAASQAVGSSLLPLANGGLNAALTASNGGVVYSTASAGAILAGTANARQMLQSGATAAPAWSTATWPATTTINQLLYSSSANTIAGLATANSSILVTDGGGVPSLSTTLPAHTLGGTVSGSGNQINNVVVGASTPLAGTFTTLGSGVHTVTSSSASALTVGLNGATNPALQVDASTALQAAGLKVAGAASGGTVAIAAIDSGSNTNLTINAKGSGAIGIGSVSTGAVTITPALTLSAALTYGGATLSNSVSGTGSMALEATGTWTPTDQSGGGVTFSAVNCRYTRIGNIVHAYGTFTFSATASGVATLIGGLPVAVPNQSYAQVPGAVTGSTGGVPSIATRTVQGSSNFLFYNNSTGGAAPNSAMTNAVVTVNILYPAN